MEHLIGFEAVLESVGFEKKGNYFEWTWDASKTENSEYHSKFNSDKIHEQKKETVDPRPDEAYIDTILDECIKYLEALKGGELDFKALLAAGSNKIQTNESTAGDNSANTSNNENNNSSSESSVDKNDDGNDTTTTKDDKKKDLDSFAFDDVSNKEFLSLYLSNQFGYIDTFLINRFIRK